MCCRGLYRATAIEMREGLKINTADIDFMFKY